jgi:hypothetical protein
MSNLNLPLNLRLKAKRVLSLMGLRYLGLRLGSRFLINLRASQAPRIMVMQETRSDVCWQNSQQRRVCTYLESVMQFGVVVPK